MALQTPVNITRAGQLLVTGSLVAADVGGTDWWTGTGREYVYINNANAGSLTVTLNWGSGGQVDGVTPTAKTFVLATTQVGIIGPFPSAQYVNNSTGFVTIAWSVTSSVKFLVLLAPNVS